MMVDSQINSMHQRKRKEAINERGKKERKKPQISKKKSLVK